MDNNSKNILGMLLRYIFLALVTFNGLFVFYFIFTPLTLIPVFSILDIFYGTSIFENTINIGRYSVEMIPACIAGAAYFLLLILNLSTPVKSAFKRATMVLFSFASFLIMNILRIVFLSIIFVEGYLWFDIIHKFFWYFLSTLFIVAIWFAEVKLFKIKEIPVYSDLKYIYKKSRFKRKNA